MESSILDGSFPLPQTIGPGLTTAELRSPSQHYFNFPLHIYCQSQKQQLSQWPVLLCIIVLSFDHQKCVPDVPFGPLCHLYVFLSSFWFISLLCTRLQQGALIFVTTLLVFTVFRRPPEQKTLNATKRVFLSNWPWIYSSRSFIDLVKVLQANVVWFRCDINFV